MITSPRVARTKGNQRISPCREFQNDVLLGHRVRAGRALRSMSQAALGWPLGLTWQQINKYENASHRIYVSRLISIAHTLRLPVDFFLSDIDHPPRSDAAGAAAEQILALVREFTPDYTSLIIYSDGTAIVLGNGGERVAGGCNSPLAEVLRDARRIVESR